MYRFDGERKKILFWCMYTYSSSIIASERLFIEINCVVIISALVCLFVKVFRNHSFLSFPIFRRLNCDYMCGVADGVQIVSNPQLGIYKQLGALFLPRASLCSAA